MNERSLGKRQISDRRNWIIPQQGQIIFEKYLVNRIDIVFPSNDKILYNHIKFLAVRQSKPARCNRSSVSSSVNSNAMARAMAVRLLGIYPLLVLIFENNFLSRLARL